MNQITSVGIDVSKGFSMVAIRQPGGVIVEPPFRVNHTSRELNALVQRLHILPGEIRIVMEHTSCYWRPIGLTLVNAGFFVSIVNAMLIHDFHDNSIRRVKTDRADALKIANYALTFWTELKPYSPEDELRQLLKMQCRLYERTLSTSVTLRNGLISLLDQTFPEINRMFHPLVKQSNGHVKWVDFVKTYWHKEKIATMTESRFMDSYRRWCKREHYQYYTSHARRIYGLAKETFASKPRSESTRQLICQAVDSLNAVYEALHQLRKEMLRLAQQLPEFEAVMSLPGAGNITGPKLMGEIGDVRRFTSKRALVAFARVDAMPYQSGIMDSHSRRMSKRGSPLLRKTLFQMCSICLQLSRVDDPVYLFMDRKRGEGKQFYVYMVAGAAKLFRMYYARAKSVFDADKEENKITA